MIVPLVNRIIWAMLRYTRGDAMPTTLPAVKSKHRIGRTDNDSFNKECVVNKNKAENYFGIPIRAQAIIRMQSAALRPDP